MLFAPLAVCWPGVWMNIRCFTVQSSSVTPTLQHWYPDFLYLHFSREKGLISWVKPWDLVSCCWWWDVFLCGFNRAEDVQECFTLCAVAMPLTGNVSLSNPLTAGSKYEAVDVDEVSLSLPLRESGNRTLWVWYKFSSPDVLLWLEWGQI